MYLACRHIKTDGLRCKSPALRGKDFCYFHSRMHNLGRKSKARSTPLQLPVPEDPASIQIGITKIAEALISGRVKEKTAGLLLYGLQIASLSLDRKTQQFSASEVVSFVSESDDGDELAPELRVCAKDERCEKCPHAKDCPDYHEYVDDPNDRDALLRMLMSFARHLDDRLPAPETNDAEAKREQLTT